MNSPTPLDACVHCGFCLPACPTYVETGDESHSPRGRLALMGAFAAGRIDGAAISTHLGLCLGCRACESACPSGVRYGAALEETRAVLPRPPGGVLRSLFAAPWSTTLAMRLLFLARRTGLLAAGRLAGASAAHLAPETTWRPWSRTVPRDRSAIGPRRGLVAVLPGCVADHAFGREHDATVTLLRHAGFDVHVPRGPLCCGALYGHAGDERTARRLVERLAAATDRRVLIVNAAGCTSHLKEHGGALSARTFDVLEFLDREGLGFDPRPVGQPLRAAWDDPCHLLHGQGIRDAPRRLLRSIPDLELVELPDADRCCGSAGTYNLAQPQMARALLERKIAHVRDAAPDVLVTANPGCQMQLAAGLRAAQLDVPVVHAVTLLAAAAPQSDRD